MALFIISQATSQLKETKICLRLQMVPQHQKTHVETHPSTIARAMVTEQGPGIRQTKDQTKPCQAALVP